MSAELNARLAAAEKRAETARDDALEEAATLLEQVVNDDDESEIGEAAADAFNNCGHREDMSTRLRHWNAVLAQAIRTMKPTNNK